jgi:hypothetical protein
VFDASCVVWPGESASHAHRAREAEREASASEART